MFRNMSIFKDLLIRIDRIIEISRLTLVGVLLGPVLLLLLIVLIMSLPSVLLGPVLLLLLIVLIMYSRRYRK